MEVKNKNTDNIRTAVSHERRDFLKAGITIAAAPIFAGIASTVLPTKAQAARKNAMSKNILIISASPRENSNSDLLSDEFMRGAKAAGHNVEKIRLSEKEINCCTGCCSCIGNQGSCVQEDDMNEILEKILAADVMVLASPVYFLSFNGQMKTFIDRVCPIYTMIHDKEVYFVVSCAGGKRSVDSIVQSFRVFTGCLHGIKEKGIISITGVWDESAAKGSPALKQAYTMGLNA